MHSLIMRYKLKKALKLIKKYWLNNIDFDTVLNNIDSDTLDTLEEYQCISISRRWGGVPIEIKRGSRTHIYSIERSELWLNRICSYILGIISGLIVAFITNRFF